MTEYIYLHGFASSPYSRKVTILQESLQKKKINLIIPDFNQPDFSHLTITRQKEQVVALFPNNNTPITLIGSSLGGLTALSLAQSYSQIQQLILFAPAFNFLSHWLAKLGEKQVKNWQANQYFPVFHYAENKAIPLHYNFILDAEQYMNEDFSRPIPTTIFHGIHDDTISIDSSRQYAEKRSYVKLIELDSDHGLLNVMPEILTTINNIL